jgi:hypothetical protein
VLTCLHYRVGIWISSSSCALVSSVAVNFITTASLTIVSTPVIRSGSMDGREKKSSRNWSPPIIIDDQGKRPERERIPPILPPRDAVLSKIPKAQLLQKKSKKGAKTPVHDINRIKSRLKLAEQHHKDNYQKKETA